MRNGRHHIADEREDEWRKTFNVVFVSLEIICVFRPTKNKLTNPRTQIVVVFVCLDGDEDDDDDENESKNTVSKHCETEK